MISMAFWLMKSEPDVFSIDDLREKGTSGWDGVRNYQARNNLRAMRLGDRAFFYYSNANPAGIAGIVEIVREAYPDPTQFDPRSDYYDPRSPRGTPRWDQVDVRFEMVFSRLITLEEIRNSPALRQMVLVKNTRLSVQPVTEEEWRILVEMAKK